jgi:DNA-binding HxlR family transcriptional regulator
MSTRRVAKVACQDSWCPIERTLGAIGGIWKVIIIRELLTGTKRYGSLHRTIGGVTHKMLTQQLRELETDGVLHREVFKQVPPKVEYSLTPSGMRLAPVLQAMHVWGMEMREVSDDGHVAQETQISTAAS